MKSYLILVVFTIIFAFVSAFDDPDSPFLCSSDEEFLNCGSACPEHCPIPDENGKLITQNPVCNRMCVPGCFCRDGTVRDLKRNNRCVSKLRCTPPNEF